MPTVQKSKNKPRVLVVVHDAGEAEIIGAHLQRYPQHFAYHALAMGAAASVFKRRGITFATARNNISSVRSSLQTYPLLDFVLLGTGDGSPIAWKYVTECRKLGIQTVGYLDHWVSYRERFGYPLRDWKSHLPDTLWVGDQYAMKLAQKLLPVQKIILVPNEYFLEIQRKYKKKPISVKQGLLFISQPHHEGFETLRNTLELVMRYNPSLPVRVRLHPREQKTAYQKLIASYAKKVDVRITKNKNILTDLRKANVVVGIESMALVVALSCGKKTISIMPNGTHCPLPFTKIHKIHSVKDLRKMW
ncbi:MAG: hypothetical protein WCS97_01395 [Candidatus Paceibacterota bacterium]|jgi:hypothetical protein